MPNEMPREMSVLESFESPESSVVAGAHYDPGAQVLIVDIRQGENLTRSYRYGGVPEHLWQEFSTADSKGAYFAKHIRPMFAGTAK